MAANQSPLVDLHSVHTRIARTMEQLDGAFVHAHKLGMARQLSPEELRAFIASMEDVEGVVQSWLSVFTEASSRPSAPLLPLQISNDRLLPLTPSSPITPAGDSRDPFFTPLTDAGLAREFTTDPTVEPSPGGVNTPRPFTHHPTPYPDRQSSYEPGTPDGGVNHVQGGDFEGERSPLPPTPSMPSPPHSCYILRNRDSNASSSSFTITPSSASPQTPLFFQRGPLSAMGHNQEAGKQTGGNVSQELRSRGEERKGGPLWDEFEGEENWGPRRGAVDIGLERLPDVVPQSRLHASLHRVRSVGGATKEPAPSPFRTPGVSCRMRLSPGAPSPVSPVQNLSFESPATFATWQKKTRSHTTLSGSSPDLRTPEMDSPPATTELQKIDVPDFEQTLKVGGARFVSSGGEGETLSETGRLGKVEKLWGSKGETHTPPQGFRTEGKRSPMFQGFDGWELEPKNPFDFPDKFAPVGDLGMTEHSPSKAPSRLEDWVGGKTVDVTQGMRGGDVAAYSWKDGVAALRGMSKSASLAGGIDPLEVDVRPDFELIDGAAALLAKKGFKKGLGEQGLGGNREEEFGLEGSPGWMDGRAALKAYGLNSSGGPQIKTARLIEPGTNRGGQKSPGQGWQEAKLDTVERWVETGELPPREETPGRFLTRWGGGVGDGKSHRRSRSHDLRIGEGTPRSDLGFFTPRGVKKGGEWSSGQAKGPMLNETDLINDGKENINPNVGAARESPPDLDLSAFPPVFRTGEGAQQLLTILTSACAYSKNNKEKPTSNLRSLFSKVFKQFPPPRRQTTGMSTGRNGSLSLSDLDALLVGYGTERLSLLLDLLASRGALQPSIVGRQMRWERPL